MELLITEDLALLLTDDRTGRSSATTWRDFAMGGALMLDLALAGAVTVEEKRGPLHMPKVSSVPGASVADPLLADALARIAEKPRAAQTMVQRLGKGTYARVAQRLAERGILREEAAKVLGIFPTTRWPAVDPTHEDSVRAALEDTLLRGAEPSARTAGLTALLLAIQQVHKVVSEPGTPARQVRARAKEVSEGEWAAAAVKSAVDAAVAALVATMAAAGGAAASGGS